MLHMQSALLILGGGILNASDWANISSVHNSIANYDASTGYAISNSISSAASQTTTNLNLSFDTSQIVEQIRAYQPSFDTSDLQAILAYLPIDSTSIAQGIAALSSPLGFSRSIRNMITISNQMQTSIAQYTNSAAITGLPNYSRDKINAAHFNPALYDQSSDRLVLTRASWPTLPAAPFRKEAGSGGRPVSACKLDSAMVLAGGITFTVLTAMSGGTDAILYGPAWAGISLWGGYITTAWATVHALICGF